MLTISTIPEALTELEKQTGRVWTDSEIFDVATKCRIDIHAAPPITAQTKIQEFVIGKGLVEKFSMPLGHSALALLFPAQVGQLWISNETETSHPSDHDARDGEYKWFTEPIKVTREQVRIKSQSLKKILAIWSRAQTGKESRHRVPEWMFSVEQEKQSAKKSIMNTDTSSIALCSESLVVQIDVGDGTFRDALPVRAIPYVAGWDDEFSVPPWSVAIRLQTNINLHAWDISAYRVLDGKPVAVQPKQWVMVAAQLAGFSEKLHRLYPRDEHQKPSKEGVAEWQSQATEKLPARAFVWLDEFKAEYRGWFGSKFKSMPNLVIPEFDLTPLLSEEVRKMVLEGFEQPSLEDHQTIQSLLDERDKLIADIKRWEVKDESQPSETLIKEKELAKLRARLAEIEEKIRVMRGDYSDTSEVPRSVESSSILSQSAALESTKTEPLPLTTGDIAFCFANLRWTEAQWKKPLGDKPKWLQSCIAIPGLRGVTETRWNPVFIGAALVSKGYVKTNSVRARFQTKSLLMPWLDAWKTYEADNFDNK